MDHCVDDLSSKRGYERERALSLISEYLCARHCFQFAQENFATILYGCLNSFKRGTSGEIVLASRTLSVLAITLGFVPNADELYQESLPVLKQALRASDISVVIAVIDCLAIASFSCANFLEREDAMKTIWQVVLSKPAAVEVLAAAISAWSFLLTCVVDPGHRRNAWIRAPRLYLSLLADGDDPLIRSAATDAVDILLEMRVCMDDRIHETLQVGEYNLELYSFAKLFQVDYILDYMRSGFVVHLMENQFLQQIFHFTPVSDEDDDDSNDDAVCERHEVIVHVCLPCGPRSLAKARSQLLNKKRLLKYAFTFTES